MYKYKVIWFDDEHESLDIIREKAFLNDIELIGFGNAKKGIEELQNNIRNYDAAVIDGIFFMNAEQSGIPSSDKALFDVAIALERLIPIKKLPWFILSGQASFTKSKNRYADGLKDNEVYDKLQDEHLQKLWHEIKTEAGKQIETQARSKYHRVFEACCEKYIGESASKHLLDILLNVEYPSDNFDDEKYFNGLRKIIEYVFRACNRIGLLHNKCIPKDGVNLTWAHLFMTSKEIELKPSSDKIGCTKIHFPSVLGRNIRSVLDITNAASHTDAERETGRLNFSEYKKNISSNHLLYSLAFQVMDLILWFKSYADENPDVKKNRALWLPVLADGSWQNGSVTHSNISKGFAFFKPESGTNNIFIPPYIVSANSLSNDDKVAVIIEDYEDTKTKEIKTRVKELKKRP